MNRKGILVVVSGFSGVGKGTLMKLLTERYGQYALSISATTRSPRAGEEDGREYFFRTREAFEELIANDQLVEYAEYCGNYYGTPREYVESQMEQGRDVILEIELQGALKIKKKFPEALLLFIVPPDAKTLLTVCGAGIRRLRMSSKSVLHVPQRNLRALSSMITLL